MSAIAARKARLTAQLDSQSSIPSDQPTPASTAKRKGKLEERPRPEKFRRQKPKKGSKFDSRVKENGSEQNGAALVDTKGKLTGIVEGLQLLQESEDDDDSSEGSSDAAISLEEEVMEQVIRNSEGIDSKVVCSTYVPIKDGKRKNWHIEGQGKGNSTRSLIIGLAPGQTLYFVGKARIKVLDGCCTISGATLTSEHLSVVIFSPQNAPIPLIEAPTNSVLCKALSDYNLASDCFTAIIEINSLPNSGIDDIRMACPLVRSSVFASSSSTPSNVAIEAFHPIFQEAKGLVPSYVPPSWNRALSLVTGIESPITCLIKGPKRVGKSTLSRYLLNRLVSTRTTSVAYLETDLGQTEFGPPGLVSLHLFGSLQSKAEDSKNLIIGPSWTSLRSPLRSHFLGDVTPKDDPKTYTTAIADLLQYYREHLHSKGIPLIMNTQGWVKGLGANLLSEIEAMSQPTHVFNVMPFGDDTESSLQSRRATTSSTGGETIVVEVEAIPLSLTRDRGLNAVESRTLNLISYFYSTSLPGFEQSSIEAIDCPQWDFTAPLIQRSPYVVNVQAGIQGGIHILSKGARVEKRLQLMALNGSCVAIVCSQRAQHEGEMEQDSIISAWHTALSKSMKPLALLNCVALGIVRSIDVEKGEIHLLTPMSPSRLASCLSPNPQDKQLGLIKGSIEVPIWLSLNYQLIEASQSNHTQPGVGPPIPTHLEGVILSDVPYLDFEVSNENKEEEQVIGLGKRRVRRNILRRSQRGPT